MLFFSFLGCDGSGKSAVIRGLKERLSNDDVTVITGHWRPRAFSRETAAEGLVVADNPHGEAPRGYLSSILKLGWLAVNWWVGWIRLRSKLGNSGVLMFDRYHADLLVDPRRYRYGGPAFLARLTCALMPQPDRVFFLDADPDVLLSRKQEIGKEALMAAREKYLALCKTNSRFIVIDASQPLEDVVASVLAHLS
jgi:thymidylate kinase